MSANRQMPDLDTLLDTDEQARLSVDQIIAAAGASRKFRAQMLNDKNKFLAALNLPRRKPPSIPSDLDYDFMECCINISNISASSGGWTGTGQLSREAKEWSMEELLAEDFHVEDWDGEMVTLLRDVKMKAFGAMAGTLGGDKNKKANSERLGRVNNFLADARDDGMSSGILKDDTSNRRGDFSSIVGGISMGGGQKLPKNPTYSDKKKDFLQTLLDNPDIQRLATFQNSALGRFFPKIYERNHNLMAALLEHDPELKVNFPGKSVMPTCTFNLGPETVTINHLDFLNMAHGICAITALGDYDPDTGGHLVLYRLRRIIRFPPGSTILIPSSILEHGNIGIQGGTRMSFTQYFPAGIVRFMDYGFVSGASLMNHRGARGIKWKVRVDLEEDERVEYSVGLFSKSSCLDQDCKKVFSSLNPICSVAPPDLPPLV